MNAFDKFIIGDSTDINWCFENTHFNQRLAENSIKREYVIDLLMEEEPLRYEKCGNNEYEVIYKAPANKEYKELRIILACGESTIDLITIMPNSQTSTNRHQNRYKSDKQKDIDKKRLKAMAKRKW